MQLSPKKSERQQTRAMITAANRAAPGKKVAMVSPEMTVWIMRLFAVEHFNRTGRSRLIEREARHLGLTCEQVIDLYHNRLAAIKLPLLEAFTDDLI